jgi:DNA-binding response OmpR family regulator
MDYAADGAIALNLLEENPYDAIILDLMLPKIDGIRVCEKLRERGDGTPILMLTARDQLEDKVTGFAAGADDYLVKPFEMEELQVRIHALIRRARGEMSDGALRVGDLVFDPRTMRVERAGQRVNLSPTSVRILKVLMRESPRLVSREQLENELWGDLLPDSDTLRSHMYNLRKGIDRPFETKLLHTVQGMGFKIATPEDFVPVSAPQCPPLHPKPRRDRRGFVGDQASTSREQGTSSPRFPRGWGGFRWPGCGRRRPSTVRVRSPRAVAGLVAELVDELEFGLDAEFFFDAALGGLIHDSRRHADASSSCWPSSRARGACRAALCWISSRRPSRTETPRRPGAGHPRRRAHSPFDKCRVRGRARRPGSVARLSKETTGPDRPGQAANGDLQRVVASLADGAGHFERCRSGHRAMMEPPPPPPVSLAPTAPWCARSGSAPPAPSSRPAWH